MRLYLDSNIYSYVEESGDATAVREYLRRGGVTVLASEAVLLEAGAIPDRNARLLRLEVIRRVSTSLIHPPFSHRQSIEVRDEIRRCRPGWLRARPDESEIERFLTRALRQWKRLRNDCLFDPGLGMPAYREAAEPAVAEFLGGQRSMRQLLLNSRSVEFVAGSEEYQPFLAPLDQSERHWRLNSASIWARALEGSPAMRDYADYLGPYVRLPSEPRDWMLFWLRDVRPEAMPAGRLHAAVEFLQPTERVTHGNAIDPHHAVHLLDSDLFLTADRSFFSVLRQVHSAFHSLFSLALPVLVDRRSDRAALTSIRQALESAT